MTVVKRLVENESGGKVSHAAAAHAMPLQLPRVIIEAVSPQVGDAGQFPAKAIVGDAVAIECDVFSDGHEALGAAVVYRFEHEAPVELRMRAVGNDRWRAEIEVNRKGTYWFTVAAWHDDFATWSMEARARLAAGQHMDVEVMVGRALVERAVECDQG